jgi:hypothetical protein
MGSKLNRLLSLRGGVAAHHLVGLGCDRPSGGGRRAIRRLYMTPKDTHILLVPGRITVHSEVMSVFMATLPEWGGALFVVNSRDC